MATSDWEPLLHDDRVGRITELLFVAFPTLRGSEVFTFVVPSQMVSRDRPGIPHEPGCPYPHSDHWDNYYPDCDCGPYRIPEQAVFAIRSDNPRAAWDPIYRGKQFMSTSGMWRETWDREEKERKHFVSAREDPAWAPFFIAAKSHADKMRGYKELI